MNTQANASISAMDADEILWRVISTALKSNPSVGISGVVATFDDRPDDSRREDVIITTIDMGHDKPQFGTSEVAVYVPDKPLDIGGRQQLRPDKTRLRAIGNAVVEAVEAADLPDMEIWVESDTLADHPQVSQHSRQIRVKWHIH